MRLEIKDIINAISIRSSTEGQNARHDEPMKLIDLTFPSPQQNLACDEALLEFCENGYEEEILRFWEPQDHFIVLGYSEKIHSEMGHFCEESPPVPVLRRCSGGGTVVQGPGCLNYTLILSRENSHPLGNIKQTNRYVLDRHRETLNGTLNGQIQVQGVTDLTIDGKKFSGNAQRRKRHFLLFHGTFLIDFDISLIEKLLPIPSKQPSYRQNRCHDDFLTNIHISQTVVKEKLCELWKAAATLDAVPHDKIESLAATQYCSEEWTYR